MNELQEICAEIERQRLLEDKQYSRRLPDFTESVMSSEITQYHKGFMSGLGLAKAIVESRILEKEYIQNDIAETAKAMKER